MYHSVYPCESQIPMGKRFSLWQLLICLKVSVGHIIMGRYTIQVQQVENHTTAVLSNAWRAQNQQSLPPPPILKYETAVYLLKNEAPTSLKLAFKIDDPSIEDDAAAILKAATGWDVTKLPEEQHGMQKLTLAKAKQLRKGQLSHYYEQKLKVRPRSNLTKAGMITELFPESNTSVLMPKGKEKRKQDVRNLVALREEVRGKSEKEGRVYQNWAAYWNSLDRLDFNYSLFYNTAGHETYQKQGLESVLFYVVLSAHAIHDEHRRIRAFDQSGRSNAAAQAVVRQTVPTFIVEATEQCLKEREIK